MRWASRLLIVALAGATCACGSMRPTRQQEWVLTKFRQCQSETNAINVNLDRGLPDGTYYTSVAQTQTDYNRLVACMKDDEASLRMYRREAAAGTGWAMASLGAFYETGRGGLEKDETEAVAWYRRGVETGDGLAMANLGNFYMTGRGGVQRDDAEAARGVFLAELGRRDEARTHFGRALGLARTTPERRLMAQRLAALSSESR